MLYLREQFIAFFLCLIQNTGTLEHRSYCSHFLNGISISLSTCVVISTAKFASCVELVAYYDTAEIRLITCALDHSSLNARYMVVSMVAPVLVN